jgi:hypothetical protein
VMCSCNQGPFGGRRQHWASASLSPSWDGYVGTGVRLACLREWQKLPPSDRKEMLVRECAVSF